MESQNYISGDDIFEEIFRYKPKKRGITGIYQHISEKYLDRYMVEFAYKYNYRGADSTELFRTH